ncbi:MAG: ABC transporter permease [Anaerolineales bacterium]|jgi:ABC-2 type transport system permease protein
MKAIDIAFKDVKQAFRNKTAVMFMFVVPILVTTLFFFIFGSGVDDEEEAFDLPQTSVQIVNLDRGEYGEILVDVLRNEGLQDLIAVTQTEDVDIARSAVDHQESGVAVIIPEDFSAVMQQTEGVAEVEIYQDPTLTLGPGIVTSIVSQLTDSFSGSKIAVGTTIEQLMEAGVGITPDVITNTVQSYILETQETGGQDGLVEIETATGEAPTAGMMVGIVSFVMAGMMIFYAFFTGASTVQSILTEEEQGTLPRLFSTPTSQSTILYGKFIASAVTIFIQVTVLLIFGNLVFNIYWGDLLSVFLVVLGTIVSATTFGIFFVSLVKNSRQAGAIMGGGITMLGMIGMSKIFTLGLPNPPAALDIISLTVPQGWAMRGITTAMDGGSMENILFSLLGMLIWSVVFFLIGNARFKRRYV